MIWPYDLTVKMESYPKVESIARPQVESVARPQVETIARVESTVSNAESELGAAEKKPLHISIRLIGDRGIGKSLIVDTYLGKKNKTEDKQNSTTDNVGTDTAVDQGQYNSVQFH